MEIEFKKIKPPEPVEGEVKNDPYQLTQGHDLRLESVPYPAEHVVE